GLQANPDEQRADRASTVRGPELLVHFAAGALPNPPLTSLVLGLLTRSAQFVKCASGYSFLTRMFAHSIYEIEPKLRACLEFAEMLACELQNREASHPRGQLATEDAATIASRRAFYEVRAAHSPATRLWCSSGSTAWTVVFEADPRFQLSCLNRFIYVKAVSG